MWGDKKMKSNIIKIFGIVILLFMILTNFCYAAEVKGLGIGDLDKYKIEEEKGYEKVNQKAGTILGVIQVIGTIVSVGVLMVVGIKYMMSSVEQKAEYKKTFILYIVGAFLLFSGTLLPSIIYGMVHK